MQKKSNLFKIGAAISFGVLLLWNLLALYFQYRLTSQAYSGAQLDLFFLMKYALPVLSVAMFFCSCLVKQKKVFVTIGAATLFISVAGLIYDNYNMIRLYQSMGSGLYQRHNIRQFTMNLLGEVACLAFAVLTVIVVFCKKRVGVLNKLMCFLPVVYFALACFVFLGCLKERIYMHVDDYLLYYGFRFEITNFPFLPLVPAMLQLVAFVFYTGYLTRDEEERTTTGGSILGVVGLSVFAFANVGCALIAMVSKALYGRVYYFNGYGLTKILWVFVFMLLVGGAVMMPFYVALIRKNAPVAPRYNPQPVYQQLVYQQPVYQQPVYQQPMQQDVVNKMNQLKQMLDMGLITQEEYETKKRQILGL